MKKGFLLFSLAFFFFVKPNLSFAENWGPILQVSSIINKDILLLADRMKEVLSESRSQTEKHLQNLKTITSFRTALPIEVCIKSLDEMFKHSIDKVKKEKEYGYLDGLMINLFSLNQTILTVQLLLTYNPNLKGVESVKNRIKSVINQSLTSIEKILKDEDLTYESYSVVRKIKSDLEEVLVILR
jgi:hypothetical protein